MKLKQRVINLSAKNWLLLDGFGAVVTAIMCQIVARNESFFGMPKDVLFVLSGVALCFSAFSFSCYFFVKKDYIKYLNIILIANITYCLATLILVGIHIEKLTRFGIFYFAGEIILVMALVYAESIKVKNKLLVQ